MTCFKKFTFKRCKEKKCSECDKWNIIHEEGREVIQQWRNKRQRIKGARKSYHEFLVYSLTLDTLKSFCQNINLMVVIQIFMAITAVYIFQFLDVSFNLPVPVLVSPIVFPLAFSINTDFQRREKVLEDLAVFKSSGMIWFFCMREWKEPAGLNGDWITAVHGKLKSLLFHLREYLLTCKLERRKVILRAMYEDFSDANQLIEKVRASQLPANTAIVSKSIQLLNMMCLSFERLRVIREYRSPRSIRSFNKVFIMFLPVVLAPYFLYLGIQSQNYWEPYYISALVAFVFSSLQSVQDKLDDPFGGMSEDDINLDTIDEWTFSSLEHTMQRSFDIGRFKVTVDSKDIPKDPQPPVFKAKVDTFDNMQQRSTARCRSTTLPCPETNSTAFYTLNKERADYLKLASILSGVKGNARINRRSVIETPYCEEDDDGSCKIVRLENISEDDDVAEECSNGELNSVDGKQLHSDSDLPKLEPSDHPKLTTSLSEASGEKMINRAKSIDKNFGKKNHSTLFNVPIMKTIFEPTKELNDVNEGPTSTDVKQTPSNITDHSTSEEHKVIYPTKTESADDVKTVNSRNILCFSPPVTETTNRCEDTSLRNEKNIRKRKLARFSVLSEKMKKVSGKFENICEIDRDRDVIIEINPAVLSTPKGSNDTLEAERSLCISPDLDTSSAPLISRLTNSSDDSYHVRVRDGNKRLFEKTTAESLDDEAAIISNNKALQFMEKYKN